MTFLNLHCLRNVSTTVCRVLAVCFACLISASPVKADIETYLGTYEGLVYRYFCYRWMEYTEDGLPYPCVSYYAYLHTNGSPNPVHVTVPTSAMADNDCPVKGMDESVLENNIWIKQLTFENPYISVGVRMCKGCIALEEIDFGGRIIAIYDEAFANCTSLRSVYIPQTMMIDKSAFSGCTALTDVTYATATLFVPEGMMAEYRAHQVWGRFEHIVEGDLSAITDVAAPPAPATCDVWSLSGALLREEAPADTWSSGLAPGVYIIRPAGAPARKAVVK